MTQEVFLCSGKRTPFGDFGKSLKDLEGTDLSIHAARACLEVNAVDAAKVDHLVCGNVIPVGQGGLFSSRVIALGTGMREDSRALNVSRACGSGTQAIVSAAEQIISGHSKIALAGGYENASRVPYILTGSRWGMKRGAGAVIDMIDYAYRDPFDLSLMGETAENLTKDFGYIREEMDDYALTSQQRAGAAIRSGFLARQIAPIEVPEKRGSRLFETDEFPRPTVTPEKLAGLKPAFREGGQVTAGNSSGLTDGAAFLLVCDAESAKVENLAPRARLVDWEIVGVPPRIMGCGPVPAIDRLLKRRGMEVDDIDYFEINEAFAVVNLHAEKMLGVPRDRTNLYGGGISIGHPPGATGVRMTLTAFDHLDDTGGRYAIISMCLGAGQGMAVLIERV
ncbi:thiolase family protein [Lutimaribacter marinistellae]|uniref:Thiolase family protein n=1 Tax=Lutimaribacter marinistellae TaxID=1820329 RepID=A0ABV7TDA6_9RHOB